MDIEAKGGTVSRKIVTVKPNDDLYLMSGERELYDGYTVAGIDCTPGFECIEFSNTEIVPVGKAIGSVDENIIKEAQIKRTIKAHFDKELRYREKGIKVLSLFFIDEVKKYRTPDGEKGIYAQMFERAYTELINSPKYEVLKDFFPADEAAVHNGYFSQDKKGTFKDTKGDTTADYDTYNTIMRDKEWLLSFDCPLRFIFSHSALKEGWDNPNVCDILVWFDKIEVRASMNKKAVLKKAFDKFSEIPFEAYDAEDTYRFYKTVTDSIRDMKALVESDSNGSATFSFFLPYETDGDAIYEFAKLIRREGFTY